VFKCDTCRGKGPEARSCRVLHQRGVQRISLEMSKKNRRGTQRAIDAKEVGINPGAACRIDWVLILDQGVPSRIVCPAMIRVTQVTAAGDILPSKSKSVVSWTLCFPSSAADLDLGFKTLSDGAANRFPVAKVNSGVSWAA
jgi:hypothetical protein